MEMLVGLHIRYMDHYLAQSRHCFFVSSDVLCWTSSEDTDMGTHYTQTSRTRSHADPGSDHRHMCRYPAKRSATVAVEQGHAAGLGRNEHGLFQRDHSKENKTAL